MKRFIGCALVLLVITAACSSSKSKTTAGTTATTAANGPKTFSVDVDHKNADVAETFTAYFPNDVQVHAGDSVSFKLQDTGEPHTVTLGSLATAAITKSNPSDPNAPPPPEDAKLPNLFPQGPGDAVQAAAAPCFLPAGVDPPKAEACTADQQKQPAFDGSQSYYNSGWMSADSDFTVKIADNTPAGVYQYICLLHREGMSGKITVVDKAQAVPSPTEVETTAKTQAADVVAKLKAAVDALPQGVVPDLATLPKGPTTVVAGSGAQAVQNGQINAFGPKQVSIPVGGTVTWIVFGDHTISFNVPENAKSIRQPGTTHFNAAAGGPAGGPGQPPPGNGSSNGPPSLARTVDGGKFDGTGYRSSGLFLSFPPALDGYKLTFTTAGTYTYKCVIHDNMEGTIKVG